MREAHELRKILEKRTETKHTHGRTCGGTGMADHVAIAVVIVLFVVAGIGWLSKEGDK
ncbi:MAG: hypothetical protein OYM47_20145 [Gemmatimonadota bacterium]|nr:hypothetical protein [Gemmatimonadota bacterium]